MCSFLTDHTEVGYSPLYYILLVIVLMLLYDLRIIMLCVLFSCLLHLVVDLLKNYYHSLLANMIPEDARFDNISEVKWLNVDVATLCCMTNKQFLDTVIMKTQNNHQLLRFCSTICLFMNKKNILITFKSG